MLPIITRMDRRTVLKGAAAVGGFGVPTVSGCTGVLINPREVEVELVGVGDVNPNGPIAWRVEQRSTSLTDEDYPRVETGIKNVTDTELAFRHRLGTWFYPGVSEPPALVLGAPPDHSSDETREAVCIASYGPPPSPSDETNTHIGPREELTDTYGIILDTTSTDDPCPAPAEYHFRAEHEFFEEEVFGNEPIATEELGFIVEVTASN